MCGSEFQNTISGGRGGSTELNRADSGEEETEAGHGKHGGQCQELLSTSAGNTCLGQVKRIYKEEWKMESSHECN